MKLAAVALAALGLAAPGSTTCAGRVLPGLGRQAGVLEAVAFASASEGWAVGDRPGGTVIERWDGKRWSVVPSPEFRRVLLPGVAAVPGEAWAVGTSNGNPLTLHWTGGDWTIVPSPSPTGTPNNYLVTVARLSATDAWAVGAADDSARERRAPLVEHWDGSEWTIASGPAVTGPFSGLNGIAALAPNDIWAVGYTGDRTLVEHWDGSVWSRIPSPNGRAAYSALLGVGAVSANDIWAVGDQGSRPLIEHWNGKAWRLVPAATLGRDRGMFWRVAASKAGVWAVGERDRSIHDHRALVQRWDGRRWRVVRNPTTGTNSTLLGAASPSPGKLVAVGFRGAHTLGLHCACRR